MNRCLLFLLFIVILFSGATAGDFHDYMDSISIYNSRYDSLLVNEYPLLTAMEMKAYLESMDYTKRFIAYRVFACFDSRDSIAMSLYDDGIGLVHVLNIAHSLKDDSLLNASALAGSMDEKIAYLKLLSRRDEPDDIDIIMNMTNDSLPSVRLGALLCLSEVSYIGLTGDSFTAHLNHYYEEANFREKVLIEKILKAVNDAGHKHLNTDMDMPGIFDARSDSLKNNGSNDE